MEKRIMFGFVFFIMIILSMFGFFLMNDNAENSQPYLTISEFYNILYIELDTDTNTSYLDYLNYDDGDEIVIRDQISEIEYDSFEYLIDNRFNHSQTTVKFAVDDALTLRFYFKGNITDEFKVNDTVEIRFHVQTVNYSVPSLTTNATIHHLHDTAVEGYNESYYQSFRKVLMPKETITKIF